MTITRKKPAGNNHPSGRRKSLKTVIGITVLFLALVWAFFPVFMERPDYVLTLTVNPSMYVNCSAGLACFAMELRNRGPWPVAIDVKELLVYPSLIGPSVNVNWAGGGPNEFLVLMPFTGQSYAFSINVMAGLLPPDRVYVILTANVTVLYVTRHVVLHSGKR